MKQEKKASTAFFNSAIIPKNSTLVVALSGGPDSLYLLHQLVALKKTGHIATLIAAHLDHEWRAESGNDRDFCAATAHHYGVPFVSKKMGELGQSITWNGSQEEIGRKARHYFLTSIMREHKADAIALGHHADDQQETFFIRLIRGASLPGLCGMLPKNGPYIRPLLELSKNQIVQFLDQQSISYLTDPTNISPDYLRNRIRASVLPALRACDDRFDHAMLQTMKRLQQTEQYLHTITQQIFGTLSKIENNRLIINTQELLAQPIIMQQRLLMLWLTTVQVQFTPTAAFLDEITRFLAQPAGGTHRVGADWYIAKKKSLATIIRN